MLFLSQKVWILANNGLGVCTMWEGIKINGVDSHFCFHPPRDIIFVAKHADLFSYDFANQPKIISNCNVRGWGTNKSKNFRFCHLG